MTASIGPSGRLRFDRFGDDDAAALARLLADPGLTRNITTNGSSAERCLASARKRIGWYNGNWDTLGYPG